MGLSGAAGALTPPGAGPDNFAGAKAPPGAGSGSSTGAKAPPGAGPQKMYRGKAPPGAGLKKSAGACRPHGTVSQLEQVVLFYLGFRGFLKTCLQSKMFLSETTVSVL